MSREPIFVIPCMGVGKRFQDEGYTAPKPFIPVNGFEAIGWSILSVHRAFRPEDDIKLILPQSPSHYGDNIDPTMFYDGLTSSVVNSEDTFLMNGPTRGAADTVARAITARLDAARNTCQDEVYDALLSRPLFVVDCDHAFHLPAKEVSSALKFLSEGSTRCAVFVFESNGAQYSYVALDEAGKVTDVQEKIVPARGKAIGGIYGFSSVRDYLDQYATFSSRESGGEHYLSCVVGEFLRSSGAVNYYHIEKRWSFGTPEELASLPDDFDTEFTGGQLATA